MDPAAFLDIASHELSELPDPLALPAPPARPFDVTLRPPGSKSLTNRALLIAALAEGESILYEPLLEAEDARAMIDCLNHLGVAIERTTHEGRAALRIIGVNGKLKGYADIDVRSAGTAARFLTAAATLADGPVTITGSDQIKRRPIGDLVALLRQLGVEIEELGEPGHLPLRVHPARLPGGELRIPALQSSQFVSAIIMLAPWMKDGLELVFDAPPTSPSYIEMTLDLMRSVHGYEYTGSVTKGRLSLPSESGGGGVGASVEGFPYDVEPDASGATYLFAAGALHPGSKVTVPIERDMSLQADARFPKHLAAMGAHVEDRSDACAVSPPSEPLKPITADLSDMPDAAMTLAVVAAFAQGTSELRGLHTLRVKESDRIEAMRTELARLGVTVEPFEHESLEGAPDEGMRITPPEGGITAGDPVTFDTYDDHRIAMSLSLVALRRPNVLINNPACVSKTYPMYWQHFAECWRGA